MTKGEILHAYRINSARAMIRAKDRERYLHTYALIGFDKELREIEILYTIDHLGKEIIFHAKSATRQVIRNLSLRCAGELWQLIENKVKTLKISTARYARKLLLIGLAHSNN